MTPIKNEVHAIVDAQAAKGLAKYKRLLDGTPTGRSSLRDMAEELIDGAHYALDADRQIRALLEYVARLEGAINDVLALTKHSTGVAGLHLNGNLAEWDELLGNGTTSWLHGLDTVFATSPLAGQPQPAPATLDRLAALERDRNTLYDAMREVCKIVGGQTADGVSVEFLLNVPSEVRLTVGKLERELAEARKDGARLTHIIRSTNEVERVWLEDWVFEEGMEVMPDCDDPQKYIRARIDAAMGGE